MKLFSQWSIAKCKTCFVLLSLFSFLFVSPLLATETPDSKVILVLDASGSMWQKIGNKTKIEIAREVIGGIIKDWNPNAHLGLTVYGHRKKGDCKDIQSLIPVSKVNPGAFMKTINAINPKGKTPLTNAVVAAAKELKYSEEKATVILISDGKETCNAYPCAVGNELEKAGVDFTAHVVGFDVSDKIGMSQLQCLAKNTGGQFFAAKDASELKKSLDIVIEKSVKEPNVKLTVVPKEGAKPFERINWVEIYPIGEDGKVAPNRIAIGRYRTPSNFVLSSGRYQALASVGEGLSRVKFEVKTGELTELTVVVGVGDARITLVPKEGAKPFEKINWVEIYPIGDDGKVAPNRIAIGRYRTPSSFVLPSGRYQALASVDEGLSRVNFEVKAGEITKVVVVVKQP